MIKSNSFKTEVAFANIPTFPDFFSRTNMNGNSLIFESVVYCSEIKDGKVVLFGQLVREEFAFRPLASDGRGTFLISEEEMSVSKKRFFEKCAITMEYSKHMPNLVVPESEGRTWYQETIGVTKIPEHILKELKPNNE